MSIFCHDVVAMLRTWRASHLTRNTSGDDCGPVLVPTTPIRESDLQHSDTDQVSEASSDKIVDWRLFGVIREDNGSAAHDDDETNPESTIELGQSSFGDAVCNDTCEFAHNAICDYYSWHGFIYKSRLARVPEPRNDASGCVGDCFEGGLPSETGFGDDHGDFVCAPGTDCSDCKSISHKGP